MTIVQITYRNYGDSQQKLHFIHHKIEKLPKVEIWVRFFRICVSEIFELSKLIII